MGDPKHGGSELLAQGGGRKQGHEDRAPQYLDLLLSSSTSTILERSFQNRDISGTSLYQRSLSEYPSESLDQSLLPSHGLNLPRCLGLDDETGLARATHNTLLLSFPR